MFRLLLHAFVSLTWSERPVWISPPLRRTQFRKGQFVRRLWLAKALRRGKVGRVFVGLGSIDIGTIRDRTGDGPMGKMVYRAETCRELLQDSLNLPPITDFERPDLDGQILRLDLAITEIRPGYAWLRKVELGTLIGLGAIFGIGHAWVQIEGVLSEQADGSALIKFVHRRRNSDLQTSESFDFPADQDLSKSLVGLLLRDMAYEILMELDRHLNRAERAEPLSQSAPF